MLPSTTIPVKDKYKIRNWKTYNKSLQQRGSISIWIEESLMREWKEIKGEKKVVAEKLYSDAIIECCLLLGKVYHQPLRQTQGFVKSILVLMGHKDFQVPDYTTLCRRQGCLWVEVSKALQSNKKIDIAIDSTGLKLYGEGEWKVRKHGASKRRTWRKLHIGIDVHTQEIICVELTTNAEDDAAVAGRMLKNNIATVNSFRGDGAYDDFSFRQILGKEVKQVIPPPVDAVLQKGSKRKPAKDYLEQRNQAVEYINKEGRKEWKIKEDYHRRSLNEVAMFRYKTAFTANMRTRKIDNQKREVALKCKILNLFNKQGMPLAYKAA
jgi:IS5 family transposase